MTKGALQGIKIIDLTTRLAGPFGTMLFSDQGAEVIKIESPKLGDMARYAGPFLPQDKEKRYAGYFQSVNRNKKSVVLDLKSEQGKEILLQLIKTADALFENFAEGTMERMGLSYDFLKTINPKLVYGALRGFGDSRTYPSPYNKYPAYDVVAQAMGGMMSITGPDAQTPTKVGPGVGDTIPGMLLAFGVLSAIHHAQKTGEGQFVDIAMADAVLYTSERIVYQHSITKKVPVSTGNMHPFQSPFGIFKAKDGHVAIAAMEQKSFNKMCTALGAVDMLEEERFKNFVDRRAHRNELEERLNKITSQFTKAELMDRLGGLIPFGPVMKMDEIKNDPHFMARDMVQSLEIADLDAKIEVAGNPIKMSVTEVKQFQRAPLHGEHNEEILKEAGVSDDAIRNTIPAPLDVDQQLKRV